MDDVNGKVETLNPLFTAVADLSVSVSDLNASARGLTSKAASAGKTTAKVGGSLSAINVVSSLFKKKGKNNGKDI